MKFQEIMRAQMMVVVLGAGLLLAKPVRAQQDMDPTIFEGASDGPPMTEVATNAPSSAAKTVAGNAAAPLAPQERGAAQLREADKTTKMVLLIGAASILLLGMVEAGRGSRRRTWRERPWTGFSSSAAGD